MDLNELLYAHQLAVMRAGGAGGTGGRNQDRDLIAEYADRVRQLREMNQMSDTKKAANAPQTIVYGSYAGDAAEPAAKAAVEGWEDEGGSLDPPLVPIPEGITTKLVRQYHVGPFVYQDLGLALAEHLRQQSAEGGKQSA